MTDQIEQVLSPEEEYLLRKIKSICTEDAIKDLQQLPNIAVRPDNECSPKAPKLVVIGPFGRICWFPDDPEYSEDMVNMERLKDGYLNAFLNRTKLNPETCVRAIKEWGSRAREFYGSRLDEDSIEWQHFEGISEHPFLEMILVDSCFIIEVIWRYTCARVREAEFLSQPRILFDARRDMILLDNQIPFFVLEGLFNLGRFPSYKDTDCSFRNLSIKYLSEFMLFADDAQAIESLRRQEPCEIKHFVDLLRICHAPFFPSFPRQPPADLTPLSAMPRAALLDEAGMVIKPASCNSSVCSLQYSRGRLIIPKIRTTNKSEILLRNLVELESREHQYESYIIDYLHFLDGLIDTTKDVDVLIKNEVIENFLSDSKAVADLFNSITKDAPLFPQNYYYDGICKELNAYCKVRRHRWRATFKRDYCSSPWMVASTIAAVILIILTFIQTVCSIISIM